MGAAEAETGTNGTGVARVFMAMATEACEVSVVDAENGCGYGGRGGGCRCGSGGAVEEGAGKAGSGGSVAGGSVMVMFVSDVGKT